MIKNIKRMIFPAGILALLSVSALNTQETKRFSTDMIAVQADNLAVNNEEDMFTVEEEQVEPVLVKEKIAMPPEYTFTEVNESAYAITKATIKKEPYADAEEVETISKYDEIKLIGKNDLTYWQIKIGDNIYYIDNASITTDISKINEMKEQDRIAEEKRIAEENQKKNQTKSYTWNGSVLTRSSGVNYGPSGKETYYNLNMSGVVSIMRSMGNNDEYWVRNDGCKMLGDYIMVAANLSVHPRGSLVETSLGTGIVCDTGGFAANNPTQIDIAVNW